MADAILLAAFHARNKLAEYSIVWIVNARCAVAVSRAVLVAV
jgi:hypothetical protein